VAGIVAMLSGFIAEQLIHPHALEQDAVAIDGDAPEAVAGGGKAAFPEPVLGLLATADIAKGEKLSKACAACHSFDQGGPSKVGPNLWGIVGGKKAHIGGFAYSDTLKNMGGTWTYADLNQFLWKPKSLVEGTKMNFAGLKKPEDRAAMIAWLRTLGSSSPLPGAGEIAAEAAKFAPETTEGTSEAPAAPEGAESPEMVEQKEPKPLVPDDAGAESKPIAAPDEDDIKPADSEQDTPAEDGN
jgi:cytochrome c